MSIYIFFLNFLLGYFIYDSFDLLFSGRMLKNWELTLHHVIVITSFSYNLFNCYCIGYNALVLAAEVNSAFLHIRKLMQMREVSFQSKIYQFITKVNLVTFVAFRFGGLIAVTLGLAFWKSRVPLPYYYFIALCVTIMWIINFVLFARLVKSDLFRSTKIIENNNNNKKLM